LSSKLLSINSGGPPTKNWEETIHNMCIEHSSDFDRSET